MEVPPEIALRGLAIDRAVDATLERYGLGDGARAPERGDER
jgi:hypothetical protein